MLKDHFIVLKTEKGEGEMEKWGSRRITDNGLFLKIENHDGSCGKSWKCSDSGYCLKVGPTTCVDRLVIRRLQEKDQDDSKVLGLQTWKEGIEVYWYRKYSKSNQYVGREVKSKFLNFFSCASVGFHLGRI